MAPWAWGQSRGVFDTVGAGFAGVGCHIGLGDDNLSVNPGAGGLA
jgi:hypothetical protein